MATKTDRQMRPPEVKTKRHTLLKKLWARAVVREQMKRAWIRKRGTAASWEARLRKDSRLHRW